jgi:elongation factor P
MSEIDVGQLRRGSAIVIDGAPTIIEDLQFVKPGKGQGLYKCKLKNLNSGSRYDRTFRSSESFEEADVVHLDMQYTYADGENLNFMDLKSFEQYYMPIADAGDAVHYLKDGTDLKVTLCNQRPVDLLLPNFVVLAVTEAAAGIKGDTATGATKGVVVETGYKVQAPLFVEVGDLLKIDTRTGEYVERVKK